MHYVSTKLKLYSLGEVWKSHDDFGVHDHCAGFNKHKNLSLSMTQYGRGRETD